MDNKNSSLNHIPGERGPARVSHAKVGKSKWMMFVVVTAATLIVIAAAYVGLVKFHKKDTAAVSAKSDLQIADVPPPKTFTTPPPPPAELPAIPGQPTSPGVPVRAHVEGGGNLGAPVYARPTSASANGKVPLDPEAERRARQLSSPVMPKAGAGGDSVGTATAASSASVSTRRTSQSFSASDAIAVHRAAMGGGQDQQNKLSETLQATDTPGVSAKIMSNRALTLPKGKIIDCALNSRISSDVPGLILCTMTRDVYSDDGSIILFEKGSQMIGEYSGGMQQGKSCIFALFDRVKTANGITVNIASPGADPLGGSGMTGYVDNKFMQRFGMAILMSVIDDGLATASNIASKKWQDTDVVYENSQGNANQLATEIVKSTINIQPTFYKNQGDRISIIVARDVSFDDVYGVQLAN